MSDNNKTIRIEASSDEIRALKVALGYILHNLHNSYEANEILQSLRSSGNDGCAALADELVKLAPGYQKQF